MVACPSIFPLFVSSVSLPSSRRVTARFLGAGVYLSLNLIYILWQYVISSSSSSCPSRLDISDGIQLTSITCSEPELSTFPSRAHLHIVGLSHGQTLCLHVYILHAYVQGKCSQMSRSHDMGAFLLSHAFQLEEEEQLCLFPFNLLEWLSRILWRR